MSIKTVGFRRIGFMLAVVLILSMIGGFGVHADSRDFRTDVKSIKTEVEISSRNIYSFKEIIGAEIIEENPSEEASEATTTFIRKLPDSYRGRITNVTVQGYDFYFDEERCLLNIEDVEPGSRVFTITYLVEGTNNMGKKKDAFDIIFLNGRETSGSDRLETASLSVRYDKDIEWMKLGFKAGAVEDANTRYGNWVMNDNHRLIEFSNVAGDKHCKLPSGIKVSLHAAFPRGYWANATEIGWTKTTSVLMFWFGIILFILMRIVFGREKEIVVRRKPLPPYNMSPMQIGYMCDGYVDDRDIIAQLLYMGQKGYWKLKEYERSNYSFEYVRYPDGEDQATKLLFNAVFAESARPGTVVTLKDAGCKLRKVVPSVRRKVARVFRGGRAAFTTSSRIVNTLIRIAFFAIIMTLPLMNYTYMMSQETILERGIMYAVGFALLLTFLLSRVSIAYMRLHRKQVNGNKLYFFLWTGLYTVVSIAYVYMFRFAVLGRTGDLQVAFTASLFLLIAPLMLFGFRSRSTKATETYGDMRGFVEYMRETRGEELHEVAGDDGKYFFRVLPYAYIFGISKRLASNFQYIDVPAPDWYMPYGCTEGYAFDVVVMNSMLRNLEEDAMVNIFKDNSGRG